MLSRSACRGNVTLLVALLALLAPNSARAFSKASWGPVYHNGVNQFPLYHRLGVSIYEVDLPWNQAAPHAAAPPG